MLDHRGRATHSIKFFLSQELRYQVSNLDIVQIGHQEVGIATNPDIGKMYQFGITAMLVNGLNPALCHGKPYTPIILTTFSGGFTRKVVAVVDDDRYARDCRCSVIDAVETGYRLNQ
jgi:hypothetical protein